MRYTAIISPDALAELDEEYRWLFKRSPQHAAEWHDGVLDAICSLEDNPARCPLSHRDEEAAEDYRQLLYGNKHHSFRILFVIRGSSVWIGHIIHGARA